jgi:hypothetical protein
MILVDTEAYITTDDNGIQSQTFRLGFCHILTREGDKWSLFKELGEYGVPLWDVESFHEVLDRFLFRNQGIRVYVVAHNMAYDYAILKLDSYLSSRGLNISLFSNSQTFIISAQNMKEEKVISSVVFFSSTNYYQMSLDKLGKIFGFSKGHIEDFTDVDDKTLMEYCKNDVNVLKELMLQHIKFLVDNDLGNFKTTIASQAMTAFRHRFMDKELLIHVYEEILKMEMDSYRGGRCEAFFIGKINDIYKLDVNSMYPFVMKEFQYPVKPISSKPIENISISDFENAFDNKLFVLAECELKMKKPFIGCKRDKLFFPIGKLTQTITNPEIEYLLGHPEIGEITKVKKAVGYEQDFIFKDYVDFFYSLKSETDNQAIRTMAKLFLNSLYGKFGQKGHDSHERIEDEKLYRIINDVMQIANSYKIEYYDMDKENERKFIKIGKDLYEIIKKDELLANNSIPIISSSVTSYSRRYLWELMYSAGLKNVYYCDTDSLFCNETGYNNLKKNGFLSDNDLGKLKLEEVGNVEIFGAKNYHFNDEVKLKGIKKNSIKLEENKYSQYQFLTKASRYRKAIPDGTVRVEPVIKEVSINYDKGVVCRNGDVKPLIFREW